MDRTFTNCLPVGELLSPLVRLRQTRLIALCAKRDVSFLDSIDVDVSLSSANEATTAFQIIGFSRIFVSVFFYSTFIVAGFLLFSSLLILLFLLLLLSPSLLLQLM